MAGKHVFALAFGALLVLACAGLPDPEATRHEPMTPPPAADDAPPAEPGPVRGGWQRVTKTDPMTDETMHLAILQASESDRRARGLLGLGENVLVLRCMKNKTEAYFDLADGIDWNRNDDFGRFRMHTRFDDGKPRLRLLSEAAGLNTSYFIPKGWAFGKELTQHDTLLVQFTKALGGGTVNVRFDLTGAEYGLEHIRDACDW